MTIAPKRRRERQNTGRRSPTAREVESQACGARDGNHELTNRRGVTCCRFCGASWADLDAELNQREATWL